jgi:hypothetical protein
VRHRNCKFFLGCNQEHSRFNWNVLMFGVSSKAFDQIPVYVRGTFIDIATFGKNRAISTFESPIAPQDYVSAVITL